MSARIELEVDSMSEKRKELIIWLAIVIFLGIPFGMLNNNIFIGFGIALCFAGAFNTAFWKSKE